MTMKRRLFACAAGSALLASTLVATAAGADVDTAFKAFWAARSPQEAAKTIPDIVKSGVGFADAIGGRP